ncbi:hypothetical protein SIID45300_01086 [Candidatus Magnetaquicoccaceae bacterium FCR-1]|uniref:MSHA biogenesis protein MshJ n=1 Tax=Candidatus Magnetaquiglobus chichijimensis TaxID=3141448 RepID=A0ABQ0C7B1_9PROT
MSGLNDLKKQWQGSLARMEKFSRRERIQLLALLLIALGALWSQVILDPFTRERANLEKQRSQVQKGIREMATLEQEVLARKDKHPDQLARERIARMKEEVESLDKQLGVGLGGMVSPADTLKLLQEMLAGKSGLKLISLEVQPPVTLLEGEGKARSIHQHTLKMRFSGQYFDLVRHLRDLERLPWKLFWDDVEFVVADYPTSYVSLRLHTLSFSPELIGKPE